MKKKIISWCIFGGSITLIALISQKFLGNDNVVEQECEKIIEKETGFTMDFSPDNQNLQNHGWSF